ncbi:MAG: nucleotidyltransferase domain-containing protein [Phormidesmis sp.]
MTSEQLLLEKWHSLPEPQQKIVLEFVNMLHDKKPLPFNTSKAEQSGEPIRSKPRPIPESERQRVMAQMKAAQADRPQRLKRMKIRQQEGWEAARKIAQMLKTDFGVERTVLFGSLLDHEHMHDRSDIDLAVWKLPDGEFFNAWTAANDVLGPYDFPPIDLVPIEKAYPEIREAIEKKGVDL